jgi:hypothetical protein
MNVGRVTNIKITKRWNGDLLADFHNTSKRFKNYFCQLLNVRGVLNVRHRKIRTTEPSVPEPSSTDVEIATE